MRTTCILTYGHPGNWYRLLFCFLRRPCAASLPLQTLEQASTSRKPEKKSEITPYAKVDGAPIVSNSGRSVGAYGASDAIASANKIKPGVRMGDPSTQAVGDAIIAEGKTSSGGDGGFPTGEAATPPAAATLPLAAAGGVPNTNTDPGQQPVIGATNNTAELEAALNHGDGASSPAVVQSASDKIDARPSEEWSDQFRDRRLMEDNLRRRALARQLLMLEDGSVEGVGEDSELGYAAEGGRGRTETGVGKRSGGRSGGGGFRKKSGNGELCAEYRHVV